MEPINGATLTAINTVIRLARDFARDGHKLKAGDLLSLVPSLPLLPPKQGTDIRICYEGLPGMPSVGVWFK